MKYISGTIGNELDDKIKSREFIKNTIPQIKDIPQEHLRSIYRKCGQMAHFTFKGQTYFITHINITKPSKFSMKL